MSLLVQTEISFVSIILIGVVTGLIAEKVTESNLGIFPNLVVGIAGSLGATALAVVLHIPAFDFLHTLMVAAAGAIVSLVFCHWAAR